MDRIYDEHEWKNNIAQNEDDELMHYGVSKLDGAPGRGSGRYPRGSGENPNQHSGDFMTRVNKMRKEGCIYVDPDTGEEFKGDTAIAKTLGMSTTQFRAAYTVDKNNHRREQVAIAKRLREEGHSLNEIADKMGFKNDSSVRTLLNEDSEARMNQAMVTANYLRDVVANSVKNGKGYIDIGKGVEKEIGGISKEKLNEAVEILKMEGYEVYGRGVSQVTNKGQQTNFTLLCPPGTEHKDVFDTSKIDSVTDYEKILINDGQEQKPRFAYPESLDSSRIKIRYADEGGIKKDGLIELRRGVDDLSLGEANYAQVRILVDGTHYLKGMAVYNDDMPDGVDVIFNTNKPTGTPMCGPKDNTVLKNITNDPKNPFGSLIKENGGQYYYTGKDGKEHLGLINKRSEEGDWGGWTDKLAAQFLSKQPQKTIDKQLDLSLAEKQAEHDEIMSLTNPTVKKYLLQSFADDCDSAAVHLKASAFPGQKYRVILPLETIKDNEVYAPNLKDGTTVYLIRYPHEGTYQIPKLVVNNKNKEGQKFITPNAKDAIGISKKAADQMSGADFDGDTVMVIPENRNFKIASREPLKGLEDFDAKMEYPSVPGMKVMKKGQQTQLEMGKISNLITDMTMQGASDEELARATKHSNCVIDAAKHELNFKLSEEVNGIAALKRKYQGHIDADGRYHEGAGTLMSRAKSQQSVIKRQGSPRINQKGKPWYDPNRPEGALVYKTVDDPTYMERKKVKDSKTGEYLKDPATGKFIYEETGKVKTRTQKSTKMAETDDAFTLVSEMDTPQERAYARYANSLKSLANQSRMEYVNAGKIAYSASAKKAYKEEVDSLDAKLAASERMAPRERKAQAMANIVMEAKKQDNPDMTQAEIKKHSQIAIEDARRKVGAKRVPVDITDKEWEAIQAGAISESVLMRILKHADTDKVRKLATPRTTTSISDGQQAQIRAMKNAGYTNAEIADRLKISTSTVSKYL